MTAKIRTAFIINTLLGRETRAQFEYTDSKGNESKPFVSLSSLQEDSNGNILAYSYAKDGHGGGLRAFKTSRIKKMRLA